MKLTETKVRKGRPLWKWEVYTPRGWMPMNPPVRRRHYDALIIDPVVAKALPNAHYATRVEAIDARRGWGGIMCGCVWTGDELIIQWPYAEETAFESFYDAWATLDMEEEG